MDDILDYDYDELIESVVNGSKDMDDFQGEDNCLETLEEVYNLLELCSKVSNEVIKNNHLEDIEKELTETDIVDYNEEIRKRLLGYITALYSCVEDAYNLLDENNSYKKFLEDEVDAVYEEILSTLKDNRKYNLI